MHLHFRQALRRLQPGGKQSVNATLWVFDDQEPDGLTVIDADPVDDDQLITAGSWQKAAELATRLQRGKLDHLRTLGHMLGPDHVKRMIDRGRQALATITRIGIEPKIRYEESHETYVVEHFVSDEEAEAALIETTAAAPEPAVELTTSAPARSDPEHYRNPNPHSWEGM